MDKLIRGNPEYEVRLYTLSLIRTSSSFWERQEIQTDMQNFFKENCTYEWKPKEWHKITQKVFDLADSCGLVATILPELKDAIINTGMKIYEWILYVHWELGLDITHALPIAWTPLGFVDEVRIFKSIWVNDASLYVGSPDKPIFRIACMLAQEDFIREHECEMIEELKKLPMAANSNNVGLEVVNYPDKVYGIMSTYVCYLVNRDSENKDYYFSVFCDKRMAGHYLDIPDFSGDHLRESMEKAINEGLILPPEMMAKLCACLGLLHGIEYYMRKLNGGKNKEVNDWLRRYLSGRFQATRYDHQSRARRFWEISVLRESCNFAFCKRLSLHSKLDYLGNLLKIFLRACPLESVLWSIVRNILNNVGTLRSQLDLLLSITFQCMEEDYKLGIPNMRYLYRKLLRKICATFARRKIRKELELMSEIQYYCWAVTDFTMLRTTYETDELLRFKGDLEYSRRSLFWQLGFDYGIPNFEIFEKFFDQMFDCPDDRIRFVLAAFHESSLLFQCDFDSWEKLYSMLDMPAPLRDSIDPMKCLCSLGCDLLMIRPPVLTNVERCDKFIKWWHKSNEEDQRNLKEKFKESSYLSECIYKLWNGFYSWKENKAQENSLRLLQWLFDSEYEISKFKKEKLSILDLLDTSLALFNASFQTNKLHERLSKFIIFSEVTGESLANAKDEIRCKIEELICKYLTFYNIETFNFLMNWVSVSEEVKKRIFQNLMESSKILKLCDDVLNIRSYGNYSNVFYNEWVLKYCKDISNLKRYLLSKYKGLRPEWNMAKLSSMYDRLERGERLEYTYNLASI